MNLTPFYWTRSAVTDECLASSKGRRGLTRAVAGAILAPHETQRQVVSGKTGSSWCPTQIGDGFCVPIEPDGEMVTSLAFYEVSFLNDRAISQIIAACAFSP